MKDRIYYEEYGDGESLILIPSTGITSYSYRSLAQKLGKRYRVIVPDIYRGYSSFSSTPVSLQNYVEKLHLFLTKDLALKRYSLVGFSLGGLIASEYLYQHPEKLKNVLLVSIYPPYVQERVSWFHGLISYQQLFIHNMVSQKGRQILMLWAKDGLFNFFLKHPKQFFLEPFLAIQKPQKRSQTVAIPTKLLIGKQDEFIPYKFFGLADRHTNVEIEVVEGNHTWFFLDEDFFVQKAYEFLRK